MKTSSLRRIALPVLFVTCLAFAAVAVAAPSGSYKGKIAYQGYDVKFKVSKGKVKNLSARMLVDCGSGLESFTIAPKGGFTVKGNKVDGKRTDTYTKAGSKATVIMKGSFSGSKFTGYVREYDFVPGSGIVCDTLNRKFTAKK